MITGIISVYDHDAYALVDLGATHSFISEPFTKRHRIESQPIDGRMVVSVPNRDTMMTGPDPDTLPGYPGWSRLVESHYTISKECTKGPHLKEK